MFDEQRKLAELAFQYREARDATHTVRLLSNNLRRYPVKHVIYGSYALEEFDAKLITEYLGFLTPTNVLQMVVGEDVSGTAIEPWFQTPYRLSSLAPDTLRRWQGGAIAAELALPEANVFLPDNLVVKPLVLPPTALQQQATQDDRASPSLMSLSE